MRTILCRAIVLLAVVSLVAIAYAQTGLRARGLYRSGTSDGMHVLVLKKTDTGSFIPVDPGRVFYKGDQIKVAFESNFDGYVYIVNVTPGGKKRVLFPYDSETNRVVRGQRYELPSTNVFIFDEEKGLEIVQVIMSREPIPFLDAAVKASSGELGETVSSAAAELSSGKKPVRAGIVAEQVTPVLPQTGANALRTRGIILSPGKDREKEGTFVAIPDKPERSLGSTPAEGKDYGKLKAGEAAVFELRLQHG